jgi:hypothetical protein
VATSQCPAEPLSIHHTAWVKRRPPALRPRHTDPGRVRPALADQLIVRESVLIVRERVLIVRERVEDGSCDDGHLHQVHMALGRFELVQLRHASLGDVERSTFVVLAAVAPTRRPGTGRTRCGPARCPRRSASPACRTRVAARGCTLQLDGRGYRSARAGQLPGDGLHAGPVTHTPIRCVGIIDPVPDEPRMVFLGFGKFARADKICSLLRPSGRSRVDAKRG